VRDNSGVCGEVVAYGTIMLLRHVNDVAGSLSVLLGTRSNAGNEIGTEEMEEWDREG
jgi:hypothetical protein